MVKANLIKMAALSLTKREEYRKILKKKYEDFTEEKIDAIIDYLYSFACWEEKIISKSNLDEGEECNHYVQSI